MTSALHATALAADVAPTSFVRARLLDKVVDLYDDYSSSPYYDSSANPFGLKISSPPYRDWETSR